MPEEIHENFDLPEEDELLNFDIVLDLEDEEFENDDVFFTADF